MLATARGRLDQVQRRLAEEEERGIARAARKLGGRRVDEDIGVDPALRAAAEAALGELVGAYVVELGEPRRWRRTGHVVVRERSAAATGPGGGSPASCDGWMVRSSSAAAEAGGRNPVRP